ncbi:MAG: guanylate kinase [Anaerolineae bacterium]
MSRLVDPYNPISPPLLVVISGPSGAGKDVTLKRMQEMGYPFHFVVTTTDRPPRPGEVDGVDYFFVSTAEFERMIEADELLEHAVVYGQHKGVSRVQLRRALESGQDVIMRLDVQGAATIRQLVPDAVLIFLTTESEEALISRLAARRTESEAALRRRVEIARQEMERINEFDYLVVNRDGALDETVKTIAAIITAEKCRVWKREISL